MTSAVCEVKTIYNWDIYASTLDDLRKNRPHNMPTDIHEKIVSKMDKALEQVYLRYDTQSDKVTVISVAGKSLS